MSEELALCPFCDAEAELDTSQMYRALSDGALRYRAAVYCTRCGADMGFCYDDAPGTPREDIVNQVVDDWNRRAPSPDMREALEALTTAVHAHYVKAFEDYGIAREVLQADPEVYHGALDTIATMLRSLTGAKP